MKMLDAVMTLLDKYAVPVYTKTGFYGALAVGILIVIVVGAVYYLGWL
jgi:hypothetical protein